jgi:hypothetical protein
LLQYEHRTWDSRTPDHQRDPGTDEGTWQMNMMTIARRVLSEFEEMPGMSLSLRQAARLFGLPEDQCRVVIDLLVDTAYLRETAAGKVSLGYRVAA